MEHNFLLSEDWNDIYKNIELVPFGIGRIGRRILPLLLSEFNVPFLIDNSGRDREVLGKEIKKLTDSIEYIKKNKCKIVVTTVNGAYQEIKRLLENEGLIEYLDFCLFEHFTIESNLRWKNRCVLSKIDSIITSNCSLRCKHCNMFISETQCHYDFSFEELKSNFDIFFDSVDYVYEYTLLGGEPFLHKGIDHIIEYLSVQYGNKIGKINLITNGTVMPKADIIEMLKKYNVMVTISDYTISIPYSEKLGALEKILGENNIEFYTIPNNVWKDVMYPRRDYTSDNPREHMRLCGHGTHSVNEGKLYWCDPAYGAEKLMKFKSKKDDFLDLKKNKENNNKYDASINIYRYILGYVNEKGYMSICEKCAGIGCDNDEIVVAGIQN